METPLGSQSKRSPPARNRGAYRGCEGSFAEIDNRSPDDPTRLIDTQSCTPALVEEGHPVLSFVLSFAALAKAGDFVPAHEALNAGCWHVKQLAQKRGVNRKAFFVPLELAGARAGGHPGA
jgi:hypothetical protein